MLREAWVLHSIGSYKIISRSVISNDLRLIDQGMYFLYFEMATLPRRFIVVLSSKDFTGLLFIDRLMNRIVSFRTRFNLL